MRKVIGLIGRKSSGKDTAAKALTGFENVKMAGALKDMLRALLRYQGVPGSHIERMIEGDLKEEPSQYLSGRTPRYAMQKLGTEWGRHLMHSDFWVNIVANKIDNSSCDIAITDVRHQNEADMIAERGGMVVRVDRPGIVSDDTHSSETELDNIPVDITVTNNAVTALEFQVKFKEAINDHL